MGPSVLVIGAGMYVCGRGTAGCGTVLPTLIQAQAAGEIDTIAVAATSVRSIAELSDKCTAIAQRFGCTPRLRTYPAAGTDPQAYRQALAAIPKPAAAIIVVPDHLHAPIAADVIAAGVHPLVVKPLAPTLAEARELTRLAEARGVHAAVEFHKRFDEANLLFKQALAGGRLGALRYCTVEYSQRRSVREAFGKWIDRTNIFQYLGVHYVDLLYFATGALPRRVAACGQRGDAQAPWDAIQAMIEWEGPRSQQFVATIATSWIDPDTSSAMSDQRLLAVGTLGRYQSDQKHRGVQLVTADGVEEINPYFSQLYADATGTMGIWGYGPRSIRQFLADVRDLEAGRVTRAALEATCPSFRQACVATAVIEAVNASVSRNGGWVEVSSG
ncbi:MAG: Gfo/Idh/MocA family oxidoreductase [Deltaproteobacteria bacterium]|nr:Gfo/Idh/MocA family oxidoreductase [Deltaproteobacteria bacterium]